MQRLDCILVQIVLSLQLPEGTKAMAQKVTNTLFILLNLYVTSSLAID